MSRTGSPSIDQAPSRRSLPRSPRRRLALGVLALLSLPHQAASVADERPGGMPASAGEIELASESRGLSSRFDDRDRALDSPRIALVFDDLGYSVTGLARSLLEVNVPLTFAVLPGLAHSIAFAESALVRGHEVILHLPMEPLDLAAHDPGKNSLMVDLDPSENARRLKWNLSALPFYSGISNHMGSRFSADREAVQLVLREIRHAGPDLLLLDSRTSSKSVLYEEAASMGLACLRNDLFLESAGQGTMGRTTQLDALEEIACSRGHAIGIGHVGPATVAAVQDAILRWQAQGIRLVGLSDLRHRDLPRGTR